MMVAGEHSGDILGAGLLKALKSLHPNATFSGIGGPRMIKLGFKTLYPMSQLSVFGLFEVLKHLPSLLKLRANLLATILDQKPDVFIGIDAPDFNLKLERTLHQVGIKTVHYVSPTVWAWRPKRIKKLQGSLNALLCIFPFEEKYFENKNVPAYYIGHPLADKMSVVEPMMNARERLAIKPSSPVLTLMPGSRLSEIEYHALLFLKTAAVCAKEIAELKIVVPLVDEATKHLFMKFYQDSGLHLDIRIEVTPAENMICASDVVLVASGTATLEVMLLKKPMVVAYKLSSLTAWVIKTFSLLKVPFVSMVNLIAEKRIVPEFIQDDATVENLSKAVCQLYNEPEFSNSMINEFDQLKKLLTCDADHQAASVVNRVIAGKI